MLYIALSVTKYNDFGSDNIVIEIIKKLYENGFPYLEITETGKAVLYGIESVIEKDPFNDKHMSMNKTKATSNAA